MGQKNILPRQGKRSTIEINDGTNWHKLVGVSSVDESGGEAQTTSTDYLDETLNQTGNPGVPTFSFTIDSAATTHAGWAAFIAAGQGGQQRRFRMTLGVASELESSTAAQTLDNVAISSAGKVTFAGNNSDIDLNESSFAPGMVLKVGGEDYVVSKIDEPAPGSNAPVKTCDVIVPSGFTAVSATEAWTLRNPQTRRTFLASIGSFPTLSVNSQQISGTATIIPTTYEPEEIVA